MKVLFLKDYPKSGKRGEVKEVSEGFAKNFLIAKGYAAVATPEIQAKITKEQKEAEIKRQKEIENAKKTKSLLEKQVFVVRVKVGDKGQVFSGVHENDVVLVLNEKLGLNLDRSQIQLAGHIKQLGQHGAAVKLPGGLVAAIAISVEAWQGQ